MASPVEERGLSTGPLQPPAAERFQCHLCQRTFGRVEHLTRHVRSHRKERQFQCSVCRKGFYRVDAMRRHEQVHENPKGILPGKGARACTACSLARRRCSGGERCSACEKRSIECIYPKSSSQGQVYSSPGESGSRSNVAGSGVLPARPEMVLNSHDEQNRVISDTPGSWPTTSGSPQLTDNIDQTMQNFSSDPRVPTFDSSSHVNPTQHRHSLHHTDAFVPVPPSTFLPPSLDGPGVATNSGATPGGLSTNHTGTTALSSHESTHTSRHDLWHQNDSMSINWLYDEYIPEYDMVQQPGLDISMFYQTSPRHPTDQSQLSHGYLPDEPEDLNPVATHPIPTHIQYEQISTRDDSQERPGQEPITPEGTDHATHRQSATGHYYVDGDGARLPHVLNRKVRRASRSTSFSTPASHMELAGRDPSSYAFPDEFPPVNIDAISSSPRFRTIHAGTYEDILKYFHQTCVSSSHFNSFGAATFPTIQTLSYFVQCYFDSFQPILPFIHNGTFDISKAHWLLILALAAIGSHYVEIDNAEIYEIALHEYLRRAIDTVMERTSTSDTEVLFSQVKLLSCIGMMYSGDEHLLQSSIRYHTDLVTFCQNTWSRGIVDATSSAASDQDQASIDWKVWSERESVRRTGYCVWLIDCMRVFHFQLPALLLLEDAKVALPCQEVLWEADTASSWQQIYSCTPARLSLPEAIQLVYVEKRLQPSMGEFSRILLIHALYRRTWEVEHYFRQPLAMWTPSADRRGDNSFQDSRDIWLPGIPTFAKWRNSACDCLDVLHWHANSVIGAASGMEHPTVGHLHVARVVLLTPFQEITKLVRLLVDDNESADRDREIVAARKQVQRWAIEDHYKARLAMIHAGVLFWHIRRYSADGFYEPSSVFLSTLALWAYGTFSKTTPSAPPRDNSPSSDPDVELPFPSSIQLDRPADDELVQLFVKRGASMKAKILGVGNLCSAKGPERILVAGRKLLLDLKCWGISRQYITTLRQLERQYRDQPST